jgi:dihydroorotase
VHRGDIDLMMLVSKLTHEPASFLRRNDLGTLKNGTTADILIFDPQKEWVVNTDEFASKGRNTPLAGTVLKGTVMITLFGGNLVYGDRELLADLNGIRN